MKYDPKKLTYGDALRIATANMTVTVEVGGVQHVTGKLKHIGPNDAFAEDNLALRDLIALALIITDNEYFVVRDDDERILCPAIRFDRDLNVTWNTIISIEENPDDGVELDVSEWKAKLLTDETPTAVVDKTTTDTQAEKWEADLPKANGIYKAATGSVWLHSGNMWTPILNRYGNVPPSATPQDETGFAISSHKAKRFPFEKVNLAKLPTEEGYYLSKDRTKLFLLDRDGFWTLVAYMGARLDDGYFADTDKCSPCDDLEYVPVASHLRVTERNMREYAPLSKAKLGLRKPRLKSVPICEAGR